MLVAALLATVRPWPFRRATAHTARVDRARLRRTHSSRRSSHKSGSGPLDERQLRQSGRAAAEPRERARHGAPLQSQAVAPSPSDSSVSRRGSRRSHERHAHHGAPRPVRRRPPWRATAQTVQEGVITTLLLAYARPRPPRRATAQEGRHEARKDRLVTLFPVCARPWPPGRATAPEGAASARRTCTTRRS